MRMKLAVIAAGALAAIAVTGASGADFEGDTGPCRETPGEPALLRCPTGYVGVPYETRIEIEEDSGCFPHVWFEIVNGSLPGGLSMSREGVISGIPTGAGLARFWVWNHDLTAEQGGPSWCAFDDRSEREFSIPIGPGLTIVDTPAEPATVGQPYSQKLGAIWLWSLTPPSGPDVEAAWSLQSGALPPGITLSGDGILSGTPTADGSYQVVVLAEKDDRSTTQARVLVVRQPVTIRSPFASARPPRAEVGIAFSTKPTATGGTGSYAWSLASGNLPRGIELDEASGALLGVPRSVGHFAFSLSVADTEGRYAAASGTLSVAPKLTIKTRRLKSAKRGRSFRVQLATAGGVPPVKWKVLRGRLPQGVRLAKKTGSLVGTSRRIGIARVTVEARDALGARSRKRLVLRTKP